MLGDQQQPHYLSDWVVSSIMLISELWKVRHIPQSLQYSLSPYLCAESDQSVI